MSRRIRDSLLALCIGGSLSLASTAQAGFIVQTDLTTGGTATSSPTDTPATELPSFAFDDLATTKGLIFNDVANDNTSPYEDVTTNQPVMWIYAFAAAQQQTVRSYTLTSANDSPSRDPRDFFLEGSNNGTSWTTVDTVSGHVFVDQPTVGNNVLPSGTDQTRFETYTFVVDNPAAFSQYRLRVVETFGTTDDRPQIGEIQLFSTVVPEPASAGVLLVLGAGALASRRRRGVQ